jgi:hypothetical protein
MSSKQIKELIDLIKKTKDKKEQTRLKKILKDLLSKTKNYNKVRSTIRKPRTEIQTGIKEQVEKLVFPVINEIKDDKTIYEDLDKTRTKQIEALNKQIENAQTRVESKKYELELNKLLERKDFAKTAASANIPIQSFLKIDDLFEKIQPRDADTLERYYLAVKEAFPVGLDKERKKMAKFAIYKFNPNIKPANVEDDKKDDAKAETIKILKDLDTNINKIIQEREKYYQDKPQRDLLERQQAEQAGIADFAKLAQDIEDQKVARANEEARRLAERRIDENANEGIPNFGQLFGDGKQKRRKVKGGAGIEDYLSFFGNIPGGSQALSMIPGFGSILAPVFDLAQSASKIGSEIGKQVKGSEEKMSGDALSSLSPMKSLLPFSLPFGKGKRKTKGGNISGLFNQVGEITPKLSGVIQKAPGAYGTLGALGNSQLGSISRVFGDIFSRFGLGKKPKRKIKGCGAVSMRGQDIPFSWYNQELGTNNIINNRLLKSKNEMAVVKDFNQTLNQKANVDQQNAVNQLLYAKLMYDVDNIQKEQRSERETKKRVVKN